MWIAATAPVAGKLAERFTVHLVDRRGRGLSGDGSDGGYDIAREVEDLAAVAEAAGEPAALLAHSFGAVVALTALAGGARFSRVLLYEPPFRTPGSVVSHPVCWTGWPTNSPTVTGTPP
jgi:pimeloyl-ACP methyl ester carboxylesterase